MQNIHNINDERREKLISKYSKENLIKSVKLAEDCVHDGEITKSEQFLNKVRDVN